MKSFHIALSLFSFLLMSCYGGAPQDENAEKGITKNIDVATFDKMIVENPGTILDVRTPDEHKQGHIENCVLVDWYSDGFAAEVEKLDKENPIYVYCHVGGRSKSAMKKLADLGFKEVYNLKGGIVAWRNVHK